MKQGEAYIGSLFGSGQMGVVYHGNYLNWLGVGRTEYLPVGMPYSEMENGILLVVTRVSCRYRNPPIMIW